MSNEMTNDRKELYREQIRSATNEQMKLALLLHAAAFGGKEPLMPAPVYIAQAFWLSEHGYEVSQKEEV